jgi:hypothetical protein
LFTLWCSLYELADHELDGEITMRALAGAVAPYLARIAASGAYPHFSRWAAGPARHTPGPQTFEQILDWLLDGLATLVPAPPG